MSSWRSLAAFGSTGEIICVAVDSAVAPVIGEHCESFKLGIIFEGELDLRNCDLRHLRRSNFDLQRSNFEGADMRNTVLTAMLFSGANFSGANMEGANLSGSDLMYADLSSANLSHSYLGCSSDGCPTFLGANLINSNLTGAYLKGAENLPLPAYWDPVSGIADGSQRPIWGNTICPDGSNSFSPDGDQGTCYNNTTPDQNLP